jgi:hypothetical protein
MWEMARTIDPDISHAWLEAAEDLGIRVTAPFKMDVPVPEDELRVYEPHILDFSGPRGTVVGVLDDRLHDCRSEQGFYCSNIGPSYRTYQRQPFIDTLNDWGWFELADLRPVWYTGKSWS